MATDITETCFHAHNLELLIAACQHRSALIRKLARLACLLR